MRGKTTCACGECRTRALSIYSLFLPFGERYRNLQAAMYRLGCLNLSVMSGANGSWTYRYDNQGQLTQAVNGSTTYSYAYDTAGNILSANGNTYTYGNASWADLLTAYNGHSTTYDAIGNPVSYYNGTRWNFTWEGSRKLESASGKGRNVNF